jgi:RNA polymerase sigma-70 factor (ECF subfamily)
MARIAQRDRGAIETFYDRHAGRALGLAARILNDRAAGEEVVQEAFWRVWSRAASFDAQRAQPSSWLLSIVHHLAIDEVRRRQSRPPLRDLDAENDDLQELPDESQDVPATVLASLNGAIVRAALFALPDAQRQVIELAYFEGYTRQEIATRLNQPLGTIHTRARLALVKLKQLLNRSRADDTE